jgi:hypothetical protein
MKFVTRRTVGHVWKAVHTHNSGSVLGLGARDFERLDGGFLNMSERPNSDEDLVLTLQEMAEQVLCNMNNLIARLI